MGKITKEDLDKLGIVHLKSKLHPKRFFIPIVGERNLYEPYDIDSIFQMIYETGKDDGIRIGRKEKINEIKNVLDINNED